MRGCDIIITQTPMFVKNGVRRENNMQNLDHSATEIKGGFWKYYTDLVREKTVHSVYNRFSETGRFDAFRCDWQGGDEKKPHIYWDSDIAKWIEGVAYLCEKKREPALERIVDETVDLIEKNQRADGYYNSYFLAVDPNGIFQNRNAHELYCTGHLIEAAIAYHKATGKDKLLRCMLKNVDLIYRVFFEEKSAAFTTPGHEEIELALLKLYQHTGEKKHLRLARFFIDQRGKNQKDMIPDRAPEQHQDHVPVREMSEAKGHAVRACYLYAAMAMLAREDGDAALIDACHRIFDDICAYKLSITGGVGGTYRGEAFSDPYDLPNRMAYNETCAAIALAMFAGEMQQLETDHRYGDLIERVLYNGFLSGLSLDGERFFYANALEIERGRREEKGKYQRFERAKVFSCSCCPPNVVRLLASISRYMYTVKNNEVWCNQFADAETKLWVNGDEATLCQETEYPFDGSIRFTYRGKHPILLRVRIPEWCVEYAGETKNGYAEFSLSDGNCVTVDLPMQVHFMESNPRVQDNAGRVAVTRGPLVYCMESVDNGELLRSIMLLEKQAAQVCREDWLPAPTLRFSAVHREDFAALYRIKSDRTVPFSAKLIPYFAFANRGTADMLIWTMVK